MKARAWLLALGAALALTSGAHAQARPPAQKTGPVTIYGDGSTGNASSFTVKTPTVPAGKLLSDWFTSPAFSSQLITGDGIQKNFAGLNPFFNQIIDLPAKKANAPEVGALFNTVSSTGGTDTLANYKMGFAAVCTANPGSASCWGGNIVANLQPGTPDNVSLIGLEIDLNNNARNCASDNTLAYPYCAGMVITGAALNYQNQAGIIIEGGSPIWNYGIAFNAPGGASTPANSIKLAAIFDNTGSIDLVKSQGAHVNGINLTLASITNCAFTSNQFCVNALGAVATPNVVITGTAGAALSASGTHTLGVDLINSTISGFAFRSTGFSVDGTGGIGTAAIRVEGTITAPALPTSGGAVRGTVCSDTAGKFYVKTSAGACL